MTETRNKQFGHLELGIGAYLGFGICDLEFYAMRYVENRH